MEIKKNNATYNRPEGERVLDGPLVRLSIPNSIAQLKSEAAWQNSDRNALTLFHNEQLKLVLIALHENAEMAPHSVDGASFLQVISGRIWVETLERSLSLDMGDGLAFAAEIPRSIFAEEESMLLFTLTSEDEFTRNNKSGF